MQPTDLHLFLQTIFWHCSYHWHTTNACLLSLSLHICLIFVLSWNWRNAESTWRSFFWPSLHLLLFVSRLWLVCSIILGLEAYGVIDCEKIPLGIFSMNVTVPHNRRDPGGRYLGFSLVLTGAAAIITSMFLLVRYWWKSARRRRGPPL